MKARLTLFSFLVILGLVHFNSYADTAPNLSALHLKWRSEQATLKEQEVKLKSLNAQFAQQFLTLARVSKTNMAEGLLYAVYADPEGPIGREALTLLIENHADSYEVELLLGSYPKPTNSAAQTLFRAVAAKHPNRETKAKALVALADIFKDHEADQAEKIFKELLEAFSDIRLPMGEVRKIAENGLIYTATLSIGKTAPETTGMDLDGKPFKISEYRGKVLLLSFGGEWCPPCRAFRATERTLFNELSPKQFEIINVAADSKETLLNLAQNEVISWRTIIDYDRTGPIARQWQIQGWPSIYLLDKAGKIRERWIGSPGETVIKEKIKHLLNEPHH